MKKIRKILFSTGCCLVLTFVVVTMSACSKKSVSESVAIDVMYKASENFYKKHIFDYASFNDVTYHWTTTEKNINTEIREYKDKSTDTFTKFGTFTVTTENTSVYYMAIKKDESLGNFVAKLTIETTRRTKGTRVRNDDLTIYSVDSTNVVEEVYRMMPVTVESETVYGLFREYTDPEFNLGETVKTYQSLGNLSNYWDKFEHLLVLKSNENVKDNFFSLAEVLNIYPIDIYKEGDQLSVEYVNSFMDVDNTTYESSKFKTNSKIVFKNNNIYKASGKYEQVNNNTTIIKSSTFDYKNSATMDSVNISEYSLDDYVVSRLEDITLPCCIN